MDGKRLKTTQKSFYPYCLALILGVTFLLRLPSLFEPFTYGDEGVYLTLGQAVRQGLVLYRDIHDNKPPLLYLVAAVAGSFPVYRLIFFYWSLVTIFVFWKLSRSLFPKNQLSIFISTMAFAILTSVHTFEGNVGNAENFMLGTTLIAFYLFLNASQWWAYLLSGVFFSFSVLFKVPAIFDFAAALVLLPLLMTNYLFLIVGFLSPLLMSIAYFASQHSLNNYLTAAFFQNLPYLASWTPDKSQIGSLPLPLLGRGLAVALVVILLTVFRQKFSFPSKLILVWFSFSLFGALLSSRPYPHYLLQAFPAFALSLGLFFARQKKYQKEIIMPVFLTAIFTIVFFAFKFWHYPNISYYLNFYQFALGTKSQKEYFAYFGSQTDTLYQTASYLNGHTLPSERIFIWGNEPSVYALSRRLPTGRYTVAYHIIDFSGYQETINALRQHPPRYLVVMETEKRPFPEFFDFLNSGYLLEEKIGPAKIFHRRSII